MTRWIMMRHAQAGSATPDEARPLTPAGQAEAARVGAWLQAQGWLPDRVLCSPATRTQQTYAAVRRAWDSSPDPILEPTLYDAKADGYPSFLDGDGTVMIVGHNPAMGDFVNQRSAAAPAMRPATVACFQDGALVTSFTP